MLFSDLKPTHSGKVRDIYEAGDHLIIVASDRISAFDCILPTPIPDKGKILTQLSLFWFERTKHLLPNHLISAEVQDFPSPFNQFKSELVGRSMLVKRAEVLLIECVVRGYLAGSGWKEYQKSQSVCGVPLPPGLRESDKLPQPIFTPTTKAQAGHDLPITLEETVELVGEDKATKARDASLSLYSFAADYALQKGIIIADTKFELGLYEGELILVDEALTPDSSRFWDIEKYAPGHAQESFDKQFVRDYLETLDWDKTPPAPELPPEIVQGTAAKYREALQRLID
jgi:phosphoribosylaminoimidazole-succinocarboxamide synthase